MEKNHSSNGSSSRDSTPGSNNQTNNLIETSIRRSLDVDSFTKFQQVLEYLGEDLYAPLYFAYNKKLQMRLAELGGYGSQLPEGFSLERYFGIKTVFFSFSFISNVGYFIVEKIRRKDDKAEDYFITLIKILVHHALTAKNDTANLALVELEQLSLERSLTLNQLYNEKRVKFLRTIIKAILQKLMPKVEGDLGVQIENGSSGASLTSETNWQGNSVIKYMTRALELFNVHTITNDDVAESLLIIISLIPKEKYNDAIKVYLESLAKCQRIETSILIVTHIQTIIVNLLLRRKMSPFDMTSSLTKLCSFCGKTLADILTTKITSIKARLLLHYSIDEKTVKDGIYYLSKFEKQESEQPFEDEFDDVKSFIDYLSPSLIGILLGIDAHFNSASKILNTEKGLRELHSLNKLISLLDTNQVQNIHVKLLSTLSLLLRIRPVRDNLQLNRSIRDLWKVSLTKLSDDLKMSLRLNICVALYDLIEDCPDEVAEIYEDLLCKSESQETDLKFLFFIPDIPPMKSIYSFLTSHVIRDDSVRNVHELKNPLEAVLPLMKHENQKCRQIATIKLKQILTQNLSIIISDMLINPDEPLECSASNIIKALLDLSSTSDMDCSALVGECLGLVGAVNPTRLDHLMFDRQSKGRASSIKGTSDPSFIVYLIMMLEGSLFSDRRSESETASYALQVVVKTYNVLNDPSIFKHLKASTIKACQLVKDTSYSGFRKKPQEINTSVYDKFKSECHYCYRDWLDKFCFNVISTMEDGRLQEVLYACSYLFRNNQALAEFILPLLIIDIVLARFGSTGIIRREIMAIIDEDVGVSTQDLNTVYSDNVRGSIQTLHFQCANMIFKALESLFKLDHESRIAKGMGTLDNKQLSLIREFTSSIPKDKLAVLAYKCRSHARALYYLEQYLFENKEFVDRYATTLQRIFVSLGDTHEAGGIEMIRTSPANLIDQSANREASGDFDGAFIGYSIALETVDRESEPDLEPFVEDSLRSLSLQGDHSRLYERSRYFMLETRNLRRTILPYAIEAYWKMSKWDELITAFKNEPLESLLESATVSQGFLLKSTLENRKHIPEALKLVRQRMMKPLSIAMIDQSAYFRGYQNLLALHSIGDFSLAMDALEDIQFETQQVDENTVETISILLGQKLDWLFDIWDKRNKLIQPSLRSLEPLLEWQRSISLILAQKYPFIRDKIHIDVGKMWLSSADSATEAKSFRRSLICLNQAQRYLGSEIDRLSLGVRVRYYIEQAKLDWAQSEHTRAIRSLKSSLNKLREHPLIQHLEIRRPKNVRSDPFPNLNNMETCAECSLIDKSERCSVAELKMLLTQYCEEAAGEIPETLFFMYEECVHLSVNQEETYLRLARYYDKLIAYYSENPRLCLQQAEERQNEASQRFSQSLMSGDFDDVITKLMEHSIIAFGNSLKYGVRYVRESMPRMISIWYDLGSRKPPKGANLGTSRVISSRIESSIRFIDELRSKRIPIYYFMTAISVLLSRVCHQHSGLSKSTQEILEMLLLNYPHQITWSLVALINDKQNEDRVKVAKSLVAAVRRKNPQVEKAIRDTGDFSNVIHEICASYTTFSRVKKQEKRKKFSGLVPMKEICPAATKFDFSKHKVMIPIQATMRARLPMHDTPNPTNHSVFPRHGPYYISSIQPDVRIFNSLQQPRQVGFKCENGRVFNIICKVGDDLRKDSRCLEFFDLLNIILKRNRQSNERFLEIKTFLVLPLDSVTGLIEMVPHCESVRTIVESLYKERRSNFTMHDAPTKRMRDISDLHQHFMKTALPKVQPPTLPTWFRRKFTEPTAWYMARLAFTRTAAVTSMGGYIIGLGDRHLDNILIDTITGKLVHVDFNLLFHQAEDLAVPERVPFRLTQNMVAAFGSLGTEGNFRKVSEITMRVMRGEKDALLTTLIPFLHDPCSEWTKSRVEVRGHREPEDKHSEDKSARARLQVIEKKLKGFPRSRKFKPLIFIDSFSVEAQVDNLIEEATDTFNLALMYYGWCPHI